LKTIGKTKKRKKVKKMKKRGVLENPQKRVQKPHFQAQNRVLAQNKGKYPVCN
jgi:hypothetical protein